MRDAVIVEAVRTPVGKGKPGGALHEERPVDLLARTLQALVERAGIDPALVDDVIGGCVTQVGDQALNITRNAVLAAGFPESVPGMTVDRQCGSSQQAAHIAAQGVISGAYDIAIACGVEAMSRVPMGSNVLPGSDPFGVRLGERYPGGLVGQGISAELIAARWKLAREELDAFALESHRRAAGAWERGEFDREAAWTGQRDESVRPGTTAEALAGLRPAYYDPAMEQRFPEIGWRVTAGNSSPVNDGAAALLIMGADVAERLGLRPRARFHSFAVAGDDPLLMLTAIMPATEKVLARAGLTTGDIDVYEVNEAFASVVLAWQRETGVDADRLNVRGGAVSIGHPLGGSGARIMTTLLHNLEDRGGRYGLQTMCEAGGLANATIIERL
ncbi:thiolase family protein [Streptomyces lunaelactis]|uniref:thiolase family protein n=2 Tax=Streptomyces lunaelactis TaxID=1535768 RepID=UPI001585B56B|nr:thiolase family protein [Streptomyces lunaelactis]NUK00607.1 thiolase family protein [Streptomyces lunaelactis]NUK08014.1 thiolase family protein [Streptomyces lunaelactis]NUK14453.1 thiolase family protein [Streptomyces lunaelactis]NUK21475.1 thiolase family protein [Streptomyces lunaelactis]NUK33572.1 thiolase family protein [Streptomyces lunaelactis]